MRVIFIIAAVLMATMPVFPAPLAPDAPQLALQTDDCAGAQMRANNIADALGFASARVTCHDLSTHAMLRGSSQPTTPVIPGLITYSVSETIPTLRVGTTFTVPSDVPWVSANGSLVAYVKLDALLLTVRADNPVETAFALEDAGVSRNDIVSEQFASNKLYVRVQPITTRQVEKIGRIARAKLNPTDSFVYTKTGFVRDCDAPVTAMSGIAVAIARAHADVMARTAQTSLGKPLGVVDEGGQILDAVCGFGRNATARQLAIAATKTSIQANGLYATLTRSIDVAWKLNLPPNPLTEQNSRAPRFLSPYDTRRPPFQADGRQSDGGELLPFGTAPDSVQIVLPDWAYDALRGSRYERYLTYVGLELSGLHPALAIHAADWSRLQPQVAEFKRYLASLSERYGKRADLLFRYSHQDCRPVIDTAIAQATRLALSQARGDRIRYLQNHWVSSVGSLTRTRCTFEAMKDEEWSDSDMPQRSVIGTDVIVGF